MAISCAYCGGAHERPDQVRRCWSEHGEQQLDLPVHEPPAEWDPSPGPATAPSSVDTASAARPVSRPRRAAEARDEPRGLAPAGPGPDELGRHAIVAVGVPAPAPWTTAPRVVVDASVVDAPSEVLERLRAAAISSERLVIECSVDLDVAPRAVTDLPPEQLGARFSFDLDELGHLVWSNAIDLRGDEPRWIWLDRAISAGAVPADGGVGDVVLPDGRPVWLDGGPVRFRPPIDGVPVVHAVSIEHRTLDPPTTNESSADLAPDQLAAVTHDGGAARIIAPAGSGKTRVLTERARHLLVNWNVPAGAVSLVAFNKRAQEEMRERTLDRPDLHVRTLNSIALAVVNGTAPFAPQPTRWRTIDEPDVRRIIGDHVSFPRRRNSDPIAPWIEALGLVRLGLLQPDEVERRYDGDVAGFAEFWPTYRRVLESQRAVDFDDQIYRALLVLLSDAQARRAAQAACRVMLVDEFQDLTPAHLLLIRLLAAPGGAVFGVGDDDQTIYGYNGADPGWLIDFAALFPGADAHPLEVNYRCPGGVVEVADRLLRHNRRRVPKTIRAASDDPGGWSVSASIDPVGASVAAVRNAIVSGASPGEIAVLARVNAVLAPVQVALVSEGIAVTGGVGLEFVDRTAVRSVLAWLRLAVPGRRGFRPDDLVEALKRPSRSFHPRVTSWISEQANVVDLFALAGRLRNEKDADRLTEFAADLQRLQQAVGDGAVTSDVLFMLIDEIGLGGSVSGLDATRRGMNRSSQGDDLTAVQQLAALHDDVASFEDWLRSALAVGRSSDGVVLATVHRVKGQEWPHVVVHHADAEQYPHRLADDHEEERRLFHVALTRASRHATIVPGPSPSPFVAELTEEPPSDRVGEPPRPGEARADRASVAPSRRTSRSPSSTGSSSDPTADLDDDGKALYAELRTLRSRLADGKPAYTVYDNKTMAFIAQLTPTSRSALGKIPGIGPAKLDRFGEEILDLVRGFVGDGA